jgi:hypothetical protein
VSAELFVVVADDGSTSFALSELAFHVNAPYMAASGLDHWLTRLIWRVFVIFDYRVFA